jgi:uncharacterized protein (TIGR02246 family)
MTLNEQSLHDRLRRIEDTLAIQQLPIRYAMAVDERDVDGWVELFVPDVQVGQHMQGRDALRQAIAPMVQKFYRSIHQIVGHRIELIDNEHAYGNVYCRAEHEVDDRWIVMAIRYDDRYRKVDERWYFQRRIERHWYAADLTERPQAVDFAGWPPAGMPNLPRSATWTEFWALADAAPPTSAPVDD